MIVKLLTDNPQDLSDETLVNLLDMFATVKNKTPEIIRVERLLVAELDERHRKIA